MPYIDKIKLYMTKQEYALEHMKMIAKHAPNLQFSYNRLHVRTYIYTYVCTYVLQYIGIFFCEMCTFALFAEKNSKNTIPNYA